MENSVSPAIYIHYARRLKVWRSTKDTVTLSDGPILGSLDLTLLNLTAEQVAGLVALFGRWEMPGVEITKREEV